MRHVTTWVFGAMLLLGGLQGCAAAPDEGLMQIDGGGGDDDDDDGCSGWQTGTLTGYNNSDEGDDPNSGNLAEFTGLTEDFYNNVAIASVDSSDWDDDRYHWVDIRYQGNVGRVGVWDMCRNEDCPDGTDCCTDNKERYATPGYLLDLETRTAARLFGVSEAENTLNDEIEYRICGAFDPDAIANPFGVYR